VWWYKHPNRGEDWLTIGPSLTCHGRRFSIQARMRGRSAQYKQHGCRQPGLHDRGSTPRRNTRLSPGGTNRTARDHLASKRRQPLTQRSLSCRPHLWWARGPATGFGCWPVRARRLSTASGSAGKALRLATTNARRSRPRSLSSCCAASFASWGTRTVSVGSACWLLMATGSHKSGFSLGGKLVRPRWY
jgi:hypothetical protein